MSNRDIRRRQDVPVQNRQLELYGFATCLRQKIRRLLPLDLAQMYRQRREVVRPFRYCQQTIKNLEEQPFHIGFRNCFQRLRREPVQAEQSCLILQAGSANQCCNMFCIQLRSLWHERGKQSPEPSHTCWDFVSRRIRDACQRFQKGGG